MCVCARARLCVWWWWESCMWVGARYVVVAAGVWGRRHQAQHQPEPLPPLTPAFRRRRHRGARPRLRDGGTAGGRRGCAGGVQCHGRGEAHRDRGAREPKRPAAPCSAAGPSRLPPLVLAGGACPPAPASAALGRHACCVCTTGAVRASPTCPPCAGSRPRGPPVHPSPFPACSRSRPCRCRCWWRR